MSLPTGSEPQPNLETAELAIRLTDISVCYRVAHEQVNTLKEQTIRFLQRRLHYNDFWALRGVNFQVKRGEVVGIIGRNGAGKSTLLKVISRVLRPTQGNIWTRGRVAPLLEFGAGFHPELTGRENVFLNGALLGFSRAQMEAKLQGIVDFAELWDFIDAPLRTYSSGMVARLGFAVATDVDPDILIIDEVFSVGDAAFQRKSAERIQGFCAAGATILLVSHTLASVQSMCGRAIWLDQGRLIADGSADAVVREYLAHHNAVEASHLAQASGPAKDQRWGDRSVEITRVRLMDEKGEEQKIFETGHSLVLKIDYDAHVPIDSPVFGVAFYRQDGVHISGPNTSFAGFDLPTLIGRGTITYRVAMLPLLEGLYQVSVAITNREDTEMYDYHDRSYPFRVVNQGNGVRERYGVVTFQGEWGHIAFSSSEERALESV